ncbi:MAG: glycosyltransferase family 4 protein [Hyphomicrobiaceae bacterium]
MIDAAFAIPGDVNTLTGGYAYARQLLKLMPDYDVEVHRLQLSAAYPYPSDADIEATRRVFSQLHPDTPLIVDGLAFGAMPPLLVNDIKSRIIALVHHPLAYETGLSTAQVRQFVTFERHALAQAEQIIATSASTGDLLVREYGVSPAKLTIAMPGTMPALRAQSSGSPPLLLAVGSIVPRKGYEVLIDALTQVSELDWRLTIVGSTERDPKCVTQLREAIMKSGLRGRITLAGEVPDRELQRHYARAHAFVMPSLFEGYGMVLTEAIARGLPIVCTTGGAIAETVPDNAAIKVEPGNAGVLADALHRLLSDSELRTNLADAAWSAGRVLPRWEDCARIVAGVVKKVAGRAS